MAKKREESNNIENTNIPVKKRGRKSKKEIETAQQNETQTIINQETPNNESQENINVIIEETNIITSSQVDINNLLESDELNDEENLRAEKLFSKLHQLITIKKQNQMLFYI